MACNSYLIATHGSILVDPTTGNSLTQKLNPDVLSKFKGKVYFVTFTEPGMQTYLEDRRLLTYYIAVYGQEFIEEFTEFINWLKPGPQDILLARQYLSSVHFKGIYKYADQILNVINSTVKKDSTGAEITKSYINVYTKKNLPYNIILANPVMNEEYFVMPLDEAHRYGFDSTYTYPVQVNGITQQSSVTYVYESIIDPNIKYVGGLNSVVQDTIPNIIQFMSQSPTEWSRRAFVDSPVKMKIPMVLYNICDHLVDNQDPNMENVPFGTEPSHMYIDNNIERIINTQEGEIQTLENYIMYLTDGIPDIYEDVYFIIPSCQFVNYTLLSPGGTHYVPGGPAPAPVTAGVVSRVVAESIPSRYTRNPSKNIDFITFGIPLVRGVPSRRPLINIKQRSRYTRYKGKIIEVSYDYDTIMEYPHIIDFLRYIFTACFGSIASTWNPRPYFGVATFYKRRGSRGTPDFAFEYCKTSKAYYIFGVCASHKAGGIYKRISSFGVECIRSWINNTWDEQHNFILGVSSNQSLDEFKRIVRFYMYAGFSIRSISCTVGPFTYDKTQLIMRYLQTEGVESNEPIEEELSDEYIEQWYDRCISNNCTHNSYDHSNLEPISIPNIPMLNEQYVQTHQVHIPGTQPISYPLPSSLTYIRRPSSIVPGRRPTHYQTPIPVSIDYDDQGASSSGSFVQFTDQ